MQRQTFDARCDLSAFPLNWKKKKEKSLFSFPFGGRRTLSSTLGAVALTFIAIITAPRGSSRARNPFMMSGVRHKAREKPYLRNA